MRRIKNLVIAAMMMVVAICTTACGSSEKKIIGNIWTVVEKSESASIFPTSVPNYGVNYCDGCALEFLSDGTIVLEAVSPEGESVTSNLCTYSFVDEKLVITAPLGSKSINDYSMDGSRLIIVDAKGNKVLLAKQK